MTFAHRAVAAAQQLDGADPASQVFGFGAILVLAGRAAHLEAVRRNATDRQGGLVDWQDILLSFLLSGVIGVILKSAVEAGFQQELSRIQNQNSPMDPETSKELIPEQCRGA